MAIYMYMVYTPNLCLYCPDINTSNENASVLQKFSLHSLPSLASTSLCFKPFCTRTSSSIPWVFRMATQASSSSSPNGDTSSSASSAVDFLTLCHRLKTTKRAGWVRRDVQNPESVADHMYRMGLMSLIASDISGVDRDKCIKMAIVHDIAEAIVFSSCIAAVISMKYFKFDLLHIAAKVEMILQALEYENEQGKDLDEFFQSTAGINS